MRWMLILLVVLLAGCSSADQIEVSQPESSPAESSSAVSGQIDSSSTEPSQTESEPTPVETSETPLKEFEVAVTQFSFDPAVITVTKGDRVKLYLTSEDVTHGISIPAFGVSTRLDPGKVGVVEFVAHKSGFFEFRCNVFCGSGHGKMIGAIEVLEAE